MIRLYNDSFIVDGDRVIDTLFSPEYRKTASGYYKKIRKNCYLIEIFGYQSKIFLELGSMGRVHLGYYKYDKTVKKNKLTITNGISKLTMSKLGLDTENMTKRDNQILEIFYHLYED